MTKKDFERLDPKHFILIKGAKVHNLKEVDVAIPRNELVVITGLSGSGKSSLAFSTLYAEGQRRYVESLSSYARQFLGKVEKPEVEYIKGISPAIAIEQKVNTSNSRSTVGTSTEIYDYLKLLFARIGKTISPTTGKEIKRDNVIDIANFILNQEIGSTVLLCSLKNLGAGKDQQASIELLMQQGYSRAFYNNEARWLEDLASEGLESDQLDLIIDRFSVAEDFIESKSRIVDSIETALFEGNSTCLVHVIKSKKLATKRFNNLFEEDGVEYIEPHVDLFSFNSPLGACPSCEGFGKVIGIDENLVIPNKSLSIFQDAIVCWKGEKMKTWKDKLINSAHEFNFPIHKPVFDLSQEDYELLWNGNKHFKGLHQFFDYLSAKSYKIQYRVMLARYRGRTTCQLCKGSRIRPESFNVKIDGTALPILSGKSIIQIAHFFDHLKLDEREKEITKRLITEIKNRLDYLIKVGLGYLSLNRASSSLSGGESQRINLASSLGSNLVGSMYILDEPSIGLHTKDTQRLIQILESLRNLGNTVIVVEHDEEIIRAADTVIDLGPYAGHLGGELVFNGNQKKLAEAHTLTAKYLNKELGIPPKVNPRKWNDSIKVLGARENNLKGIDVEIPLHAMTVVSGVSGSGKSSLVKKIILPGIQRHLGIFSEKPGLHQGIEGELDGIQEIQYIDQNPIGKSSRSNPVTYIKAYDEIRSLFANQKLAKSRAYQAGHFSFNVEGGRCETCHGEGEITEEMQFMADIHLTCETCNGKRFKEETLAVHFHGKSIADVLELTIQEAVDFFGTYQDDKQSIKVGEKLMPLIAVGLGYVKLGQASGTLSGGEAQRIKLATYLGKGNSKNHILFIFDEPSTGLHFHDIIKLLDAFNALIEKGHSLLVVEHNTTIIQQADWVIDLGPEGGDLGGELMFQGTLGDLYKSKNSITAKFLA